MWPPLVWRTRPELRVCLAHRTRGVYFHGTTALRSAQVVELLPCKRQLLFQVLNLPIHVYQIPCLKNPLMIEPYLIEDIRLLVSLVN